MEVRELDARDEDEKNFKDQRRNLTKGGRRGSYVTYRRNSSRIDF